MGTAFLRNSLGRARVKIPSYVTITWQDGRIHVGGGKMLRGEEFGKGHHSRVGEF